MTASSSTEIPPSLEVTNIFEACIKELNELCTYCEKNTSAPDIFGRTVPLSPIKQSRARYLLVYHLRILFHELREIQKNEKTIPYDSLDPDFVVTQITRSIAILKSRPPAVIHYNKNTETIMEALWIKAYLLNESLPSLTAFPKPINYEPEDSFNLDKNSRLSNFLKSYKTIYDAYAKKNIETVISNDLLPAIIWFINSPEEKTLLSVKENTTKLYIYPCANATIADEQAVLSLEDFKKKQSSTALRMGGLWLSSILFPEELPGIFEKTVKTGEADRRTQRAIDLLDALTPSGLFQKVFQESRKPNRKAMTFALLIAIMWDFKKVRRPDIKLMPKQLYFFRDKFAPFAREIIAAGQEYKETQSFSQNPEMQREDQSTKLTRSPSS
jgi:hypothetical protein